MADLGHSGLAAALLSALSFFSLSGSFPSVSSSLVAANEGDSVVAPWLEDCESVEENTLVYQLS